MPDDIKRMRYYNGLFLQEEEFQLEQEYNVRLRRIHNARLHSKGIVWGLDVILGQVADTVIVKQGMALDYYHEAGDSEYQGREIIVTEDRPVDLAPFAANDVVWIWIRYDESPAGDDLSRGDEPFNIIEGFQIETSTTKPLDEDLNIILAVVTINLDGTIDAGSISTDDPVSGDTVRIPAGFSGARVETENLTLRVDGLPTPYASLVGTEFFPNTPQSTNGITVQSTRTDFDGEVRTGGDVAIDGGLTVQQATQLTGDLTVSGAFQLQSGVAINEISDDATLTDNSPSAVPTEQAVRSFVETQIANFINNELVGQVVPFAMNTPPTGWLECDGSEVSRATYSALYARIGDTFGAGDGSTTFDLPDLRGEFVRGWDNGRGVDGARAFGDSQDDQFQGHWHDFYFNTSTTFNGSGNINGVQANLPGDFLSTQNSQVQDSLLDGVNGSPRTGPETRPRNVSLMYCIRH